MLRPIINMELTPSVQSYIIIGVFKLNSTGTCKFKIVAAKTRIQNYQQMKAMNLLLETTRWPTAVVRKSNPNRSNFE